MQSLKQVLHVSKDAKKRDNLVSPLHWFQNYFAYSSFFIELPSIIITNHGCLMPVQVVAVSYLITALLPEPLIKCLLPAIACKKKNPSAAISEPVKLIIYYLDGTPEPIRSALLEGAQW
jgi:hypothetical protein